MVVSVAMLTAGSDPAGYYLARQANCPADYYLGAEPIGRWLGSGAATAGLTGPLDATGSIPFAQRRVAASQNGVLGPARLVGGLEDRQQETVIGVWRGAQRCEMLLLLSGASAALGIVHHLRLRFTRFKLRAYLLDL